MIARAAFAAAALLGALAAQGLPAPEPVEALARSRCFFVRNQEVWSCDGNGADLRRWSAEAVKPGSQLELAPDAEALAVMGTHYAVRRADGAIDLGVFRGFASRPAWSHDGRSLAFGISDPSGTGGVWISDDTTIPGSMRRLTAEEGHDDSPAFSPDGSYLALAATVSSQRTRFSDVPRIEHKSRVEILDRKTGARSVACERVGAIADIAWSPDGRHLAFEIDGDLCVVPIAGSTAGPARVLCKNVREGGSLEWSPDGKSLLADRGMGRGQPVRTLTLLFVLLDGEVREQFVARDARACFGPNADWVFLSRGDLGVYRLHVPSKKLEQLVDEVVDTLAPMWWRPAPVAARAAK